MKFILDASVVIAFFRELDDGQFLYALTKKGFELYVTDGVVAEIKKEPELSRLRQAVEERWIACKSVDKPSFERFKNAYPMLDYAEVEVLIYCLSLKSRNEKYCCVLDEGAGRRIADVLGITKTGTLGLLEILNDNQIIDNECKEKLLNRLEQSTFRLRKPIRTLTNDSSTH